MLLSAFVALGVVGAVLTRVAARLSVTLTVSDPTPTVGDDAVLTAHLRHCLPWSLPLRVMWQLGEEKRSEELMVPKGAGVAVARRVSARNRGPMTVGIAGTVVDGLLGLARVRWRLRARHELLVLPPLLPELPEVSGVNSVAPGAARREYVLHGVGEPSGSVREYRDGDAMRHVHWKQSARQGDLLVNVPDNDTGGDGVVYLDVDGKAYPDGESFERAVAAAATVGARVLGGRENLLLQIGDADARRVSSSDELLRALARIEVQPSTDVESAEDAESRARIHDPFARTAAGQAVAVTGEVTARLRTLLDTSATTDGTIYTCGSDHGTTAAALVGAGVQVEAAGQEIVGWPEVKVSPALMPTVLDSSPEGGAVVVPSSRYDAARRVPVHLTRTQLLAGGGILLALWLISFSTLTSVLEPGPWMRDAGILAAILILVPAGLRVVWQRLRTSAVGVGFVAALAAFPYLMSEIDRLSQWWWQPLEQLAAVHLDIQSSDPPMAVAGATQDFFLLVILLTITVSALLFVALDSFLVAGLVPLATYVVTPVVMGGRVSPVMMLAAGALLVALMWLGSARRTWGGLVAGLCALALAVCAVNVFPAGRDRVWNSQIVHSSLSANVPDLTVALGEDLRARSNTVVFRYAGGQGLPMRFPLATLSEFSEGRWHPQDEPSTDDLTVGRTPYDVVPSRLDTEPYGRENSVTITIAGLVSNWLPMPQNPYVVSNPRGSFDPSQWTWMEDSNTAHSTVASTRRGDQYTVFTDSVAIQLYLQADGASNPQRMTLADDGITLTPVEQTPHWYNSVADAPEELRSYLQLPGGIPDSVSLTAEQLTAGADDPLIAAAALAAYFTSGEFVYDESAPYQPGMDSDNPFEVMDALLQTKRGYCVHFSSTFAVMARSVGIPSRVALGYASAGGAGGVGGIGGVGGTSGAGEVAEVSGRQLHAWPEIFVDDLGWVAFEPTPGGVGGGAADAESDPEPSPESSTTAAEPTPGASTATVDPAAGESGTGEPIPDASVGDADDAGSERIGDGSGVWRWLGILALLLVVAGGPAGARAYRSRRRAAVIVRGDHPARTSWREVVDSAVDLGLDTSGLRALTWEAVCERLVASGLVNGDEAIADAEYILAKANAERYGAGVSVAGSHSEDVAASNGEEDVEDAARSALLAALNTVVANMRANVTRAERVKARILPNSMLSRARHRLR